MQGFVELAKLTTKLMLKGANYKKQGTNKCYVLNEFKSRFHSGGNNDLLSLV
jgi:hypothetical protein